MHLGFQIVWLCRGVSYKQKNLTSAFILLFQSRGSTRDGTGVHDSIVNQLLTKVGVDFNKINIIFSFWQFTFCILDFPYDCKG